MLSGTLSNTAMPVYTAALKRVQNTAGASRTLLEQLHPESTGCRYTLTVLTYAVDVGLQYFNTCLTQPPHQIQTRDAYN